MEILQVEYWHGAPATGAWKPERPSESQYRVPGTVHESSTLHIGDGEDAPVGLDYRLKRVSNVYITGAGLWPQGGSWNPTLFMVALAMDLADKHFPARDVGAETGDGQEGGNKRRHGEEADQHRGESEGNKAKKGRGGR
jgi:hypothetical protein